MSDDYNPRVPREEKTDWKNDVRKALVAPSFATNEWDFKRLVDSSVNILALTYPGWNAFKEVNAEIEKIKSKHNAALVKWCDSNLNAGKFVKRRAELHSDLLMHDEIWTYLKNYAAKYGMLIEGPRNSDAVDFEVENLESANEE